MDTCETTAAEHEAQREAARVTVGHRGPTADRYAAALARYVSAVSADSAPRPRPAKSSAGFPPMTVADVMTKSVVSAYPGAQFKEIAQALHRNGINSVPVLNEQRHVVGVVTASDLLARISRGGPAQRGHRPSHQDKRHKVHGGTAHDLMSTPAITLRPGASIADAARLMSRHRVRSVPVVDRTGRLVGMVSRADLIELFLRSDEDIRHDVERDVLRRSTVPAHANVQVTVDEGVVTLSGHVPTALTARGLAYRAADVPGVVDVRHDLAWDVNDLFVPTHH